MDFVATIFRPMFELLGLFMLELCRSKNNADSEFILPSYTIRKSQRAKRVILRMRQGTGLEIVLPAGVSPKLVPEILKKHQGWIAKMQGRYGASLQHTKIVLPLEFLIKGGTEHISVCAPWESTKQNPLIFQNTTTPSFARQEAEAKLLHLPVRFFAMGQVCPTLEAEYPVEIPEKALAWLKEWIREQARTWLGGLLEFLAKEHGFKFSGLCIKFQKTRWGSCSSKGNINLNAALLFLPLPLVRYIILHELCHTRYLDHSQKFWRELFAVEPEALKHDKAMRKAWKYVPTWLVK